MDALRGLALRLSLLCTLYDRDSLSPHPSVRATIRFHGTLPLFSRLFLARSGGSFRGARSLCLRISVATLPAPASTSAAPATASTPTAAPTSPSATPSTLVIPCREMQRAFRGRHRALQLEGLFVLLWIENERISQLDHDENGA